MLGVSKSKLCEFNHTSGNCKRHYSPKRSHQTSIFIGSFPWRKLRREAFSNANGNLSELSGNNRGDHNELTTTYQRAEFFSSLTSIFSASMEKAGCTLFSQPGCAGLLHALYSTAESACGEPAWPYYPAFK